MQPLNFSDDAGSAPLEIVGFGVLMMIPIMWFSINIMSAQNDQFAAAAIAEHGLRAWVQAETPNSSNFEVAIHQIAKDFHEPEEKIKWMFDCADINPCQPQGQVVHLQVRVKDATATASMRWAK